MHVIENLLVGVWALRYLLLFIAFLIAAVTAAELWMELRKTRADLEAADIALGQAVTAPPIAVGFDDRDITPLGPADRERGIGGYVGRGGYVHDRLPDWLPPDVLDLADDN